jgi:hypothetical protein
MTSYPVHIKKIKISPTTRDINYKLKIHIDRMDDDQSHRSAALLGRQLLLIMNHEIENLFYFP